MKYRTMSLLSAVAAAVLVTACDSNQADDVAKTRADAQEESARIQREADQKIAEARRVEAEKVAEAQREAQEKMAEARVDVAEERRELQESIKTARQSTKDEYLEYARKRARLLELQAAELKAKAAEVPPAAQRDFDKTVQEIDQERRSVLSSLDEVGKDTKDAWRTAKAKIDKELNDLEKRVEMIDTTDANAKSTIPVNPKSTDATSPRSTTPAK
jgi:hypothetical protein